MSHFSVKINDLNEKWIEIRKNANNEILELKMKNDEAKKNLKQFEKLLAKTKAEHQEIILNKNKEIKILNQKLLEADKKKKIEDKKASAVLVVKIFHINSN